MYRCKHIRDDSFHDVAPAGAARYCTVPHSEEGQGQRLSITGNSMDTVILLKKLFRIMDEPEDQMEKILLNWEHMFSEDRRESNLKDLETPKIEKMHLNLVERFRIFIDPNPEDSTPLYPELKRKDQI
uniref:Uncharacterized protein n=1 Tax=Romanomermis culicivorax TaxID=13658 RepID=A0A915JN45_ROMCU